MTVIDAVFGAAGLAAIWTGVLWVAPTAGAGPAPEVVTARLAAPTVVRPGPVTSGWSVPVVRDVVPALAPGARALPVRSHGVATADDLRLRLQVSAVPGPRPREAAVGWPGP